MQCIYLKNKSYSIENLPSEPGLLVELLDLCRDDAANFEMFSSAIKKDVALTAKILQVANSPAYRQWNELVDIRRMLIVLGMTNVRNIVTTCAIQQFFANFTKDFSRNVQFIWLRALICANLAERISDLIGYKKPGEVFLAGLLHQVGMLLFLLNREKDYLPLLDRYFEKSDDFCELEQQALHADHCELGAALVESWKLDSFIADAILFQHAPADELQSSPMLLKILAVASPLSSRQSARENATYLEKAGKLFDLTEDTILDCLDQAVEKSTRMISDLGFSGRFYSADEAELFEEEQHNNGHQKLSSAIQNIALGTTIGRSHKTEIVDFTKETRASFSTLFNQDKMLFFTVDEQQTALYPVNDLEQPQLDEIEFTLSDNNSLLVKAFHTGDAVNSLSEKCSIADKQTMRLLEAEVVYMLPIIHDNAALGVLVLGTTEREWPRLEEKTDVLDFLSGEIATKYFSLHQKATQPAGMSNIDFRKIAHEISNPLTIINNYLYMLGRKIDAEHSAQEEIAFISEEIERVGSILLRAKDPSAPTKNKYRHVNINKLLKELDTLFQSSLYKTYRVESTLQLDGQVPTLNCPQDKLKQVLINIIKNAAEAMVDGGQMTITTRDNVYQNNQQFVEISLRDTGPGINAEILKNLFQPVTSTKEGHSGLGLTIVNTLVQELSGHISCYSRQGEGTEFKILIPRYLPESEIELK